jgi:transcription elongation factor Elf1
MNMDSLLETVEADVVCGQCGNKVKRTIAWLKTNGMFDCAVCGAQTDLRTQEWTDRIQGYIDACTGFDD